jgi:hypothetical protein
MAPQDIVPRHAQEGIAQLGRRITAISPDGGRLGHVAIGRSILKPVATKFAPVNTQSHVIISQEPIDVAPISPHAIPWRWQTHSVPHQAVAACEGELVDRPALGIASCTTIAPGRGPRALEA